MEAIESVLEDYYPTSTQQSFTMILQDEIGKYISATTTPEEFIIVYKNCKSMKKKEGTFNYFKSI
jgi:hypothetical protein